MVPRVDVWVVDHPADITRLFDWGVDGVISDRPDLAVPTRHAMATPMCCSASSTTLNIPTLADVYAARAAHSPTSIRPTPLLRHALLAEETGLDIWVKHENHNPTSAFKVRGGLNLVRSAVADERAARRRHRQHRQPRPVDCHGLPARAACACTVFVPDRQQP